jgi:hypothetical protein
MIRSRLRHLHGNAWQTVISIWKSVGASEFPTALSDMLAFLVLNPKSGVVSYQESNSAMPTCDCEESKPIEHAQTTQTTPSFSTIAYRLSVPRGNGESQSVCAVFPYFCISHLIPSIKLNLKG